MTEEICPHWRLGQEILFFEASISTLGSTQAPIDWVSGAFPRDVVTLA